eukprot:2312506-Rhodomonas_salina.1
MLLPDLRIPPPPPPPPPLSACLRSPPFRACSRPCARERRKGKAGGGTKRGRKERREGGREGGRERGSESERGRRERPQRRYLVLTFGMMLRTRYAVSGTDREYAATSGSRA